MRSLLLIVGIALAFPAIAQERIFRASPIDMEQDAKILGLEVQVDAHESATAKQFVALQKSIDALAEKIESKPKQSVEKSILVSVPEPVADDVPNSPTWKRYCIGDVKWCEGELKYLACVNGEEKWIPVPTSVAASSVVASYPVIAPSVITSYPVVSQSVVTQSQPVVITSSRVVTQSRPVVTQTRPVVTVQRSTASTSSRYSTSELRAIIQQKRPGGWRGAVHADVSPRSRAKQHLTGEHGFTSDQVSGLSQDGALILHDLAHGGQVSSYRSGSASRSVQAVSQVQYSSQPSYSQPSYSQPAYQPQPVHSQPVYQPQPAYSQQPAMRQGGCPNGRCPLQGVSSGVVRGFFGFRR